ncbi:hypothetical protein SAMN05421664_3655 [Chryseobacterium soldanellicola]|uniref:Uncharacterized protein n=1 Tax=Chryseobacterium soldanellicola TaxID=311333 RepID=A0A1H1GG76_9FLAO|nr:hypothetical protein [Chryseobacterium soldanellicola]SDR12190.1 hypothetical protein SAMN05421664_3655 [Chryseobacterium soldanellicola]
MATYESLITIKGAVGDLVFYNLNGKNVVRKKSGFNKTAFKKSPTYEKVRHNSSEFGHCSKIGKIIRKGLDKYIKESGDPLLYQSFAKMMTEVKDLDTISERGNRTVKNGLETEKGKLVLNNFQFGKKQNLKNILSVKNGLFEKSIQLEQEISFDEIEVISLKIDFENYVTESLEEKINVSRHQKISFQKHFTDDDFVLNFIVLKANGKILNMGFV